MKEFKYIKTADGEIILFPLHVAHSLFKPLHPVSAGFCTQRDGVFRCYGKSESLGLGSDPDDAELTNHYFNSSE